MGYKAIRAKITTRVKQKKLVGVNIHRHQPKNEKYPQHENFISPTVIYKNSAHFFVLGYLLFLS